MQTFLPFPDLLASAEVLDDRRLGKQRVETLQILRALTCEGYGWANHPAVTMWRGHIPALVTYGSVVVGVWSARGYADTTADQIAEFAHPRGPRSPAELAAECLLPPWWGHEPLHRSHRSALLRKDPEHYGPRFPADTPDDLDYVWPPPPAPPRERGPRSAWVVRGRLVDGEVVVGVATGDAPWVPLDARTGRTTKAHRQASRIIDEMAPGDALVVPEGSRLEVLEITGGARHRDDGIARPVRSLAVLERSQLEVPAVLQDPQLVFALHDEPAVARAVRDAR